MFSRKSSIWTVILLSLTFSSSADAEVRPANLFTDGMVLQQGMPVPVWGWADPGEEVTLEYRNIVRTVKANEEGKWMIHLDPMRLGDPFTMKISGDNEIQIRNVLVGEVWLCSGQSNMAWTVDRCLNAETEIAEANYPEIRMFSVKNSPDFYNEAKDATGQWDVCGPETVAKFSAAGYFFGRELHTQLDVPVGLINSSWGGTPIESWTQQSALSTLPSGKANIAEWEEKIATYDPAKEQENYQKALDKWRTDKEEGKKVGRAPRPPLDPKVHQSASGALFNGRIAPLIPYAISGAIWYQGEANSASLDRAIDYRNQLPLMIDNWRTRWEQGEFPFLYVQLPNYDTDRFWPAIRESMLRALETPNTGMAITIDIGEAKNIHPKNKQEVGYRLALLALHDAYGKDIVYSGPLYDSMKVDGDTVVLSFTHTGAGLMAKGEELKGFTVAGEDRKFVPATARIEGNTVIVTAPGIENPVAVRYAWENNPVCNLFNEEGLPASPFRTDLWPLEQ